MRNVSSGFSICIPVGNTPLPQCEGLLQAACDVLQ